MDVLFKIFQIIYTHDLNSEQIGWIEWILFEIWKENIMGQL